MDRYVVFGNPIGHSKSPLIHRLFAEQTGQNLDYQTSQAPLDNFATFARDFFVTGLGANVTVPFKEQAFRLADELQPRAQRAGAVNTLSKQANGRLVGDNTDGAGLVADLTQNARLDLTGLRILLLGAGGAVRGVLAPLLAQRPKLLTIANRTESKAHDLAEDFADLGPVDSSSFTALHGSFDVIVNATSAGLAGELPAIDAQLITPGRTFCYDMLYAKEPTAFCRWAMEHGAIKAMDGLGMLVEQAAEAFYIWRGVRPKTQPVMEELLRMIRSGH